MSYYELIQVSLARCDIAATSEPKDCADRIINQGRLAVAVCGVELETNLRRSLHNHKGLLQGKSAY